MEMFIFPPMIQAAARFVKEAVAHPQAMIVGGMYDTMPE